MKKFIALSIFAVFALAISSFVSNRNENNGEDTEISNSAVWKYMHENVFEKLNTLVDYDKKKSFSRCPSGFAQYMDNEKTTADQVYGTITFARGCERDHFCFYKIDWENKKTFLRKSEKEKYVALDTFVKNYKVQTAKI